MLIGSTTGLKNNLIFRYLLSFKLKHIWLRSEFLEEELRKVFLGGGGLTLGGGGLTWELSWNVLKGT